MSVEAVGPWARLARGSSWTGVILVGVLAFAFTCFLTQGERLFDNDHDWIAAAQAGWCDILGRILTPIPGAWGFQERPVQVLFFKLLFTVFGNAPAPYYAFKALLFAAVVCGTAIFCLRTGLGPRVAFTAAGIFALSGPVFSSVLWVSDFELLAQVFIVAAFGAFLALEQSGFYSTNRIRFHLCQGVVFLLSLLGHRAKGSAKLIPAVLLVYLLVYRRDALRRHLPLLGLIAITVVPVFALPDNPMPPFAPFSEDLSQGWMWKPANLATLRILVVGNAHLLWGTTGGSAHSLLGVLCPVLFWAALAGVGLTLYRRRRLLPFTPPQRATTAFTAIWLAAVITSFSAFPQLPMGFMARYVTGALVPAGILIALLLVRAAEGLPKGIRAGTAALLALILLGHGAVNFRYVRAARDSLGQLMVAYDRARVYLSESVRNANILMLDLPFGYSRLLDDDNLYLKRLNKPLNIDLSRPLYALVQQSGDVRNIDYAPAFHRIHRALRILPKDEQDYRVEIRPVQAFHGLTDSFYERWIYRSTRSVFATLFHIALEPVAAQKRKKE